MKKLMLTLFVFFSLCLFCGCGQTKAESLMSEQTRILFAGEGDVGNCLISVGEREEPYIVDGHHGENTGFSLIVFTPSSSSETSQIEIDFSIDGIKQQLLLELNPLNMTYVADLGYALEEKVELRLSYQGETIELKNISTSFAVDYKEAIKVGLQEVEASEFVDKDEYECYLKIVEGERFGQEGYFWCFSVVCETKTSKNILISVDEGKIILG